MNRWAVISLTAFYVVGMLILGAALAYAKDCNIYYRGTGGILFSHGIDGAEYKARANGKATGYGGIFAKSCTNRVIAGHSTGALLAAAHANRENGHLRVVLIDPPIWAGKVQVRNGVDVKCYRQNTGLGRGTSNRGCKTLTGVDHISIGSHPEVQAAMR